MPASIHVENRNPYSCRALKLTRDYGRSCACAGIFCTQAPLFPTPLALTDTQDHA